MDRNGPVEAFSRGFDTTLQKSPAPRRINILQLAGYHAGLPPKPWSPNYCTASAALSSPFSLPRQPSFRLVKGTNFVTIPLPLPSFPFERRKRNELLRVGYRVDERRRREEEEEDNEVAAGCRYNVYLQRGSECTESALSKGGGRGCLLAKL